MIVLWDGGLYSYELVHATLAQGSHFLSRIPCHVKLIVDKELPDGSYLSYLYPPQSKQKKGYQPIAVRVISYTVQRPEGSKKAKSYRLITNLLDSEATEARMLAEQYQVRWEEELTINEWKTHLLGRKVEIRSENPREVVQEVYGILIGHWVVRNLMAKAASEAGISPLSISFTASIRVIRRAIPKFQQLTIKQLVQGRKWLFDELLDELLPERVKRYYPRVVKKQCSKYPTKKMNPRAAPENTCYSSIPLIAMLSA